MVVSARAVLLKTKKVKNIPDTITDRNTITNNVVNK